MFTFFSILIWLVGTTNAHLSAFQKGMYCLNGTQKGVVNQNANEMVQPMFELDFNEWWFHHVNGCDEVPPMPGDILELPAGGSFTVEIADNQAHTTFSYGGKFTSEWVDGAIHDDFNNLVNTKCITSPNMHTQNKSMAAGTAFAISYQSDLSKVSQDNLVVFSVRYFTPWKRVTTYDVPKDMPSCPAGGCICAWSWIPNGCGEPNMYMQGFKCIVTNSISKTPLATPKAAVWCEDAPDNCTKGAKQLIAWNQRSGDNIEVEGFDKSGGNKSPGYNNKCGFSDGAQNDIFAKPASAASKRSCSEERCSADDGENDTTIAKRSTADIPPDSESPHKRNSPSFRLAGRYSPSH